MNPGDPAFPGTTYGNPHWAPGLTKREYFTAMAMQGILASQQHSQPTEPMARDAVIMADAMIAELNK